MRKLILLFSFMLVSITYVTAQHKIYGIVQDNEGNPIPGVTVIEKGTNNGIIADSKGGFTLSVKAADAVILFSFIGMETVEEPVNGRSEINVLMKEGDILLEEVVVTALGIKRKEKSLGYSVTEVKGDDISKVKDANMMSTLAGKVPGLVITQSSGGPTGSSRVIIRGNTSISGNNQPLYVIDGVPMENTNFGNTGGGKYASGYDMGDAASSINPDDIESISVLKGPSAAALYGSSASNGVIMITMKKGAKKDLGIEFSSTLTLDKQATHYEDVQNIYGQGSNGMLPTTVTESQRSLFYNWGPRLDPGINVIGWDGVERPYANVKNNIDGFFKTGHSYTNTIALSQMIDKTAIRLSYSNLTMDDIIPKTGMKRHSINLSSKTVVGERLTVDARIMYMFEHVNNRPALADASDNISKSFFGLANNIDQAVFASNYKTESNEYIEWGGGIYNYNPYWVINDMKNTTDKNRIYGGLALTYEFTKWLNLKVTANSDQNSFNFEKYSPVSTPGALTGSLEQMDRKATTSQADALLSFEKDLSPTINLAARVGVNYFKFTNEGFTNKFTEMTVLDVVSPNSFTEKSITKVYSGKEKNSLYGILAASYKNFLFLDATVRRDASSTLPEENNTYMYPSISGSFVFTDAFKNLPKAITFGKIRASAAEVGSDTDPYMLDLTYSLYPYTFNETASGLITGTILPNKELKPTRTRSFETGVSMKFLNNRVGFDFTYYYSVSRDQINTVVVPYTSGFNSQIINVGSISNKGIELALNATPVKKNNFNWDIQVNFAKNNNNVESLAEGLSYLTLSSARWCGVTVVAKPGEPYGAIMGYNYQRDPDGNIILDPTTRRPVQSTEKEVLGNGTFDWTGGVVNTFSYKKLNLTVSIDIKHGGQLFSMSNLYSISRGQSEITLEGRDEWIQSENDRLAVGSTSADWLASGNQKGFVPKGVIKTTDGEGNAVYTENTQGIDPYNYYSGFVQDGQGVCVPFIYDASYIKLRDVAITYNVSKVLANKLGVSSLAIGFVARNPWIISKHVPNIDPDSNYYNGNGQGLELGSLPTRRNFGFSLKFTL